MYKIQKNRDLYLGLFVFNELLIFLNSNSYFIVELLNGNLTKIAQNPLKDNGGRDGARTRGLLRDSYLLYAKHIYLKLCRLTIFV